MNTESKEQVQTAENTGIKDVVTQDKRKRKILVIAVISVAFILFAAIIIGMIVLGGSGKKLQEQLDLGTKYLEEMDYEQALVAFNTALSIDPKNADAYLGIVEVYIRTNEFESALKAAKEGYEATRDERLKEKIDMIESGDIFASNGWVMKTTYYDGDGNLMFRHEYTYNLKGQKASVAKYNAQGVQEQYLELAYDEEGRMLINYAYGLSGNLVKVVYKYDGYNYRETWYEGTSDVISTYSEIESDAFGRILKATTYEKDGRVSQTEMFEYDETGNLIKSARYTENNELIDYQIHTYDENGRDLLLQEYDSDGKLMSYSEYVYDADGNWIESRFYDGDGELRSYTEVVYDTDGNEIGTRYYHSDGVLQFEDVSQ